MRPPDGLAHLAIGDGLLSDDSGVRPAGRLRVRPRWLLIAVIAVLVFVTGGVTAAILAVRSTGSRVTASSTAAGFDPANLATARAGSRAVAWRSSQGSTTGVTLRLSFPRATVINHLEWRGADGGAGPTAARVAFSDGSALLVTSSDRDGDFLFTPRRVTALTLTVTSVRASASSIALASLRAGGGAPSTVTTRDITARNGGSQRAGSAELAWTVPSEIASATLRSSGSAADRGGRLRFSDGSTVDVAGLTSTGTTTVAFTPRVVTSVRYLVGQAQASLPEIAVAGRDSVTGSTRSDAAGAGLQVEPTPLSGSCSTAQAPSTEQPRPVVLCPTAGASVGPSAALAVSVGAGEVVTASAWRALPGSATEGAITEIARGTADSTGLARLTFSTARLLHGPVNVRLQDAVGGATSYAQLVNRGGIATSQEAPEFTDGMTLQFQDRFRSPVSVSDTGANTTYTATKPSVNGPTEFGEAVFAGADWPGEHIGTLPGGPLRLRVTPTDRADPGGYDRKSIGALLSSTGLAGNGFSAQYGYFEARMLGAPGVGTWPAFWTQSVASMSGKGYPFGEADAVELYGHDTASACHGAVDWTPKATDPDVQCATGDGIEDWALEWHTYGVRILPGSTEIYVDGRHVRTLRALGDAGDPFFFMVNLELGGGWPIDLSQTGGITDLYVSDIRVYT